jgi:hypothetical protein
MDLVCKWKRCQVQTQAPEPNGFGMILLTLTALNSLRKGITMLKSFSPQTNAFEALITET